MSMTRSRFCCLLRDDKPGIPYPNMWDIPGGHAEYGETPEQCIVREMKEEMDLNLEEIRVVLSYGIR